MNTMTTPILVLVLAGVMNAGFTLPMKYTRRWAWENTWLCWTVFTLLLFPPLVALGTMPPLGRLYGAVDVGVLLTTAAFGAGWGVSQVFCGLAVDAIGMSVALSVLLGVSVAFGSLIPLVRLHRDKLFASAGLGVISGVAIMILGVSICAVAGRKRESTLEASPSAGKAPFGRGLLFAVLAGLGSALLNLGIAFGAPLLKAAADAGTDPMWTPNAVWLPLLTAGAIPNLAYCVYLMRRHHTGGRFSLPGTWSYWLLSALMGFLWFASTLMYGIASGRLGDLGAVLGWPLYLSLIVIGANAFGFLTGEWKTAGKGPVRIMIAGVATLVLAVFVLAYLGSRS